MKNLVIVESPAKSKTIEKYLGKDYQVLSSKGHIRDLATSGKGGLGINVENNFEPTYTIDSEKKKVVKELIEKSKKADKIFLATDPDREGEAISWHLAQVLNLDLDNENRIVFNEITKKAVLNAIENPRKIDLNLVKSQETRRFLDRIIGFKLSKLLQSKIKSKSAGRVQSVALRMIVDKEKEINDFKPTEYWTLKSIFEIEGKKVETELVKYQNKKINIPNYDTMQNILNSLGSSFTLFEIKKEDKKRAAKLPFTTSSLQQEMSSKFGYSAKKTMQIAQKLYEGIDLENETVGLITYMRTDSTRLSNDFVFELKKYIESNYGKEYVGYYKVKNDDNAQDAHEAIRITHLDYTPASIKEFLTSEQYKVYSFIYYRTLASLMANSISENTTYNFNNNDYIFTTNGSILKFDGFLKVYQEYDSYKDNLLPMANLDQKYDKFELSHQQHFTEPPLRYSESRLIKTLEEEGIGRPSTYATIIDTIVNRGYVEYKKLSESGKTKYFVPTEQGFLTDEKLKQYFSKIIDIKYTANLESELDLIAENKLDSIDSLRTFYNDFEPLVENAYKNMEKIAAVEVGELCPLCNLNLVYRQGRFGKFIACSSYPECKYTRKIEDTTKTPAEKTGIACDECDGELLKRKSKYGKIFLGCSKFPKCRVIKKCEE